VIRRALCLAVIALAGCASSTAAAPARDTCTWTDTIVSAGAPAVILRGYYHGAVCDSLLLADPTHTRRP